jgi:hypothetical protein
LLAQRLAAQLAATHANRLYFGPFATSNVSVNAEIFDFGAARAVPNWGEAVATRPAFGFDDLRLMSSELNELELAHKKFARAHYETTYRNLCLSGNFESAYTSALGVQLPALFGLDNDNSSENTRATVTSLLKTYFHHQQRATRLGVHEAWIGSLVESPHRGIDANVGVSTLASIERTLEADSLWRAANGDSRNTWFGCARRLLAPRNALYRESIQRRIYSEVVERANINRREFIHRTMALINEVVASGRRVFSGVPSNFAIVGASIESGCVALFCRNARSGKPWLLLRGPRFHNRLKLFGSTIHMSDEFPACVPDHWIQVPISTLDTNSPIECELSGQHIKVPAANTRFESPHSDHESSIGNHVTSELSMGIPLAPESSLLQRNFAGGLVPR